jgi:hypothetical protein
MMLVPALLLSIFGLAVWTAGIVLEYRGIAVLGGVVVVGVGTSILLTGLEQQVGTVEQTVNSSHTIISAQTEPVTLISSFDAGLVWSLLGSVLTLQGIHSEG